MSAFGPSALAAAAFFIATPWAVSVALAAGGQGGNPSGFGSPNGAGGTGFTGNAGENSNNNGFGSGGGGGGAGGGNGGLGDFGFNNAAGGNGGTSGSKNGANGTNDVFGGGGGGGGYNGNGPGAASITNGSALAGGNGGSGGNSGNGGGGGGAGGYGAVVLGAGASSNSSSITGGTGGNGGSTGGGFGAGGSGGDGGVGVWFDAPGATFTNSGTVTGGDGGAAGSAGSANGLGGVGVAGAGLTVIMNGGSISGGLGGDGVTRADAIAFTGGNNTLTLNGGSLTGNVSIAGGNISFNQAGSYNLTNAITGTGSISHDGAGTLTLSNTNTYSGGTTVSAGTLVLNHVDGNNVFDAAGSGAIALNGGKLVSGITGSLAQDVTFNAGKTSTLAAATGTTLTIGGTAGIGNQPARIIIGANGVAQFGSATETGTIEIGRSSSISLFDIDPTAELVVAGGTLRDVQDQLFNLTAGVRRTTINSGATLDFNDSFQQVLVNLNGGGSVMTGTTGTNALAIFSTGGTTNTFSGVISGSHPVTFNTTGGNATMILTGDNTYTGGTTICFCMTLQLGNGGTTGSIVGDIVNENRLIFNRSNTYTFNGLISDIGDVVQNGTGTTVLTNDNTYSGGTTVNAGRLVIGNGGTTGSIAGNVTVNGGAFGVNRSDIYIMPNAISGNGGFDQLGSGTTIFDTAQTYTGTTTIGAGTLQIGNGGVAGSIASTNIVNNGTLAINKSNPFALNATISGTGGLNQIGTGTTTLNAATTYSGATNITAGILRTGATDVFSANSAFNVGASGTLNLSGFNQSIGSLAGSGAVTLAAATLTTGGDNTDSIFSGAIAGAGGVTKTGAGTFTYTGTNTYTGGTTINGGSLRIGNGGTTGSIAGDVAVNGNGTLIFDRFGAYNFNGNIAGTGAIRQAGIGTVVLGGNNSGFTGGISVGSNSVLRAGTATAFGTPGAVSVSNLGVLDLNNFNFNFGSLRGQGTVQIGTGSLGVGSDNTNATYSGIFTGTGLLTKVGSGTFTFNGSYSGGPVRIVGGTFAGTGSVGDLSISGATFAPGDGTATVGPSSIMNVTGTLGLNVASTYAVNINPVNSSLANVTGAATLGGATVNAIFAPGTYVVKQYTILRAGSINGAFDTLVNTNLPTAFSNALSYDATHAYLNLTLDYTPPGPPGYGNNLSGNQKNVADTLVNYFNRTGGIPIEFGFLTARGLSQVSGEPGASVPTAGFAAMGQFINAMTDGSGGNNNQGGALGFDQENAYAPKRKLSAQQSDAYAAVTPRDRRPVPFESRWNVWATGYGGNSTVNGNSTTGSHNTSTRVFGTAVGADYRATPDTRFGFALGGAGTNFSVDSGLGGGRADVFQAGAYARHQMGAAYLTGAVAYGWQDVTTDRTITVVGTDKLRASFAANSLAARLEGGWRYAMPVVAVTPYAAAQTTTFYLPSYAESAISGSNQFALSYASKTVTATRAELGARFDKAMVVQGGVFTLKAKTAWAHDWNTDRSATATFQTLPGATFTVNGAQPSADVALVSLGGEMGWHNGWTVAANFDGEFSRTTASYAGRGSLRYAW